MMEKIVDKLSGVKKFTLIWNYFPQRQFIVLVGEKEVFSDDVNSDVFYNYILPMIDDEVSEIFAKKTGLKIKESIADDDFEGYYIKADNGKVYYVKFGESNKIRITGLQEDSLTIDFTSVEIREIPKDWSPF